MSLLFAVYISGSHKSVDWSAFEMPAVVESSTFYLFPLITTLFGVWYKSGDKRISGLSTVISTSIKLNPKITTIKKKKNRNVKILSFN